MIPKEVARQIRYIQIFTSKVVNDVLAGEYESVFKGRGMEFDEVREYEPGDDVRSIDWNVTARTGKPFIKRYREERELTVIFLVDLSASGSFGSVRQLKSRVAADICAMLAFAATKNNDKVGLIAFTDRVEKFIPPKKGTRHVLRIIREILSFSPEGIGTDMEKALDYVGRVQSRKAVVFLISDFQDTGYEKALRILSQRHDMIAVTVVDPREVRLPDVGLLELEDAETGELALIDTSSAVVRHEYEVRTAERRSKLTAFLRSVGVDQIPIPTGRDYREYTRDLLAFFKSRERRRSV